MSFIIKDGIEINQNKKDFKMSIKKNRDLMVEQMKRLRGELNEAETDGMSKDLIKKIEVVIKKGLGINKLADVSGPAKSRRMGELNYFFKIGSPSIALHYGPTQINVTKQISSIKGYDDWYTAAIDMGSWEHGKKQYTTEAELLKGIYNMVKKNKDELTFVINGKSYLQQ